MQPVIERPALRITFTSADFMQVFQQYGHRLNHVAPLDGSEAFTAPIITKGYTVATLPAGTLGMIAHVTDALAPAFLVAVAGGGAVKTPVFYNGAAWVAI